MTTDETKTKRQTCTDHCSGCGQHFHGLAAFDAHRVGDFANGRRCLNAQEMAVAVTEKGRRTLQVWTEDGWCNHEPGCYDDGRHVHSANPVVIWQGWMDEAQREALLDLQGKRTRPETGPDDSQAVQEVLL